MNSHWDSLCLSCFVKKWKTEFTFEKFLFLMKILMKKLNCRSSLQQQQQNIWRRRCRWSNSFHHINHNLTTNDCVKDSETETSLCFRVKLPKVLETSKTVFTQWDHMPPHTFICSIHVPTNAHCMGIESLNVLTKSNLIIKVQQWCYHYSQMDVTHLESIYSLPVLPEFCCYWIKKNTVQMVILQQIRKV